MARLFSVTACALLASALSACSASPFEQGPNDALRGYSRALEEKRIDDAYRYLSDDAKRSLSFEAFRRAVEENPAEVMEVAQSLTRPTTDPVVTAVVSMPTGEELHMVFEDGRWRVDSSAVDLYSQATPRQALVGFIRAFERKRYDVVLRYVTDADREGVDEDKPQAAPPADAAKPAAPGAKPAAPVDATAAAHPVPPDAGEGELTPALMKESWEGAMKDRMNRIVQALKAALPTATIEETGEFASMPYGSGSNVTLVRERGAWKIKDF